MTTQALRGFARTLLATVLEILAGALFATAWIIRAPGLLISRLLLAVGDKVLDAADDIEPLAYCRLPKRRR